MQLSVCWGGKSLRSSVPVRVEVEDGTTCSQLVAQVVESLELNTSGRGAWHLVERWRGCGKLWRVCKYDELSARFVACPERQVEHSDTIHFQRDAFQRTSNFLRV